MEYDNTHWSGDTHALVEFEDGKTAVVPVTRIVLAGEKVEGGECSVMWSNKKRYKGTLITKGSKQICEDKQDELDEESDDESMSELVNTDDGERDSKDDGDKHSCSKERCSANEMNGERDSKDDGDKHSCSEERCSANEMNGSTEKHSAYSDKERRGGNTDKEKSIGSTGERKHEEKHKNKESKRTKKRSVEVERNQPPKKKTKKVNDKKENKENKKEVKKGKEDEFVMFIGDDPPRDTSTRVALKDTTTTSNKEAFTDSNNHNSGNDEDNPDFSERKVMIINVDDSNGRDTTRLPQHYFGDYMEDQLDEILQEISDMNVTIQDQHQEQLNTKMDSIRRTLTAVLARELSPHLKPTNAVVPSPTIVPVVTTTSAAVDISVTLTPTTSLNQTAVITTQRSSEVIMSSLQTSPVTVSSIQTPTEVVDIPTSTQPTLPEPQQLLTNEASIPIGRDITIDTSGEQLMSLPELTKIFNKSCSRRNMAANLIRVLVDEETRKYSNVSGRGKDMLDPVVVNYVKNMCFQFFPLSGSEKKADEWSRCVVSIDESSRRLKNKPRKQKP